MAETKVPATLPELLVTIYGPARADALVAEAKAAFEGRHILENWLAIYCNAATHIQGATEFERGVEEGKRRVWLELAALRSLRPSDFPKIKTGESFLDG
jgi:hypothetical protein